jgi:hypothetical protein
LNDITDTNVAVKPLCGKIINLETLFPEWNIEAENWFLPASAEQLNNIIYPQNLKISDVTSIASYFHLSVENEVVPSRGKTPKKDKKTKDVQPTELTENLRNENGQQLPIVFKDFDNEKKTGGFNEFTYNRNFFRHYSKDQKKLLEHQNKLRSKIDELKLHNSSNISNESNRDAINHLEIELTNSINDRNMFTEEPDGVEIDSYICSAYRLIIRFGASIFKENKQPSSNSAEYLWRSIYPKLSSGKPCYNPSGKYCVRLFVGGAWRKVYVDDKIPLRADGSVALASSSEKYELWPIILAKAIYSVFSACGLVNKNRTLLIVDIILIHFFINCFQIYKNTSGY